MYYTNIRPFVTDVISILDYDTALQMDGLDEIINGNLSERYSEITDALLRCNIAHEADILKKAKRLSDTDKTQYEKEYENLYNRLAFQNDYDSFWEKVRAYINQHLKDIPYEYRSVSKNDT